MGVLGVSGRVGGKDWVAEADQAAEVDRAADRAVEVDQAEVCK